MLNVDELIVFEAKRWLNVVERGGNNRGEIIQMFQKAADNRANGEPWCAAFVYYCVDMTRQLLWHLSYRVDRVLPQTEHCLTMWRMTPPEFKAQNPSLGHVVIWQLGSSMNGHCGIVIGSDKDHFFTIEGNTGSGDQREGDGVYLKKRPRGGFGKFKEVGFIQPLTHRII